MTEPEMNPDYAERLAAAISRRGETYAAYAAAEVADRRARQDLEKLAMEAWGCPPGTIVWGCFGNKFLVSSGSASSCIDSPPVLQGYKINKKGQPGVVPQFIGSSWRLI